MKVRPGLRDISQARNFENHLIGRAARDVCPTLV